MDGRNIKKCWNTKSKLNMEWKYLFTPSQWSHSYGRWPCLNWLQIWPRSGAACTLPRIQVQANLILKFTWVFGSSLLKAPMHEFILILWGPRELRIVSEQLIRVSERIQIPSQMFLFYDLHCVFTKYLFARSAPWFIGGEMYWNLISIFSLTAAPLCDIGNVSFSAHRQLLVKLVKKCWFKAWIIMKWNIPFQFL